MRRCCGVHLAVDLTFHIQSFGGVLLHIVRAPYRFHQRGGRADATKYDIGRFSDQSKFVQLLKAFPDERKGLFCCARRGIVKLDRMARTREDRRPSAADQTATNNGNLFHSVLCSLLIIRYPNISTPAHTEIAWPVMFLPISLARYSAMFAMS